MGLYWRAALAWQDGHDSDHQKVNERLQPDQRGLPAQGGYHANLNKGEPTTDDLPL